MPISRTQFCIVLHDCAAQRGSGAAELLNRRRHFNSVADFGFSDSNGSSLEHVTITALPATGTLTLNGVAVAAGQQIAAAAISGSVWRPAANVHGQGLARLQFTVTDDGGTANGGQDTSVPHVLTFNVTPVNDAPLLNFTSASTPENKVLTMDVLADAVDVDGDTLTLTGASLNTGVGSVSIVRGTLVYDPTTAPNQNIDKGASRAVTFNYTVSDGHDELVTETITITVDGVSSDVVKGPNGADTFQFRDIADSTAKAGGRDRIFDFSQYEQDRIDLHLIDANETRNGNQSFRIISSDDFHGRAGELRFEVKSGHPLIQADTDGDGKADFAIQLDGIVNMRKSDFLL